MHVRNKSNLVVLNTRETYTIALFPSYLASSVLSLGLNSVRRWCVAAWLLYDLPHCHWHEVGLGRLNLLDLEFVYFSITYSIHSMPTLE